MRKIINYALTSMLFMLPITLPAHATAERLLLDNQHSYVLWTIEHLGFSTQAGKWYVNGEVTLDKANPKNSKVDATVKVADVITGIPELDKHLRGKLFFNTDQFPTATFVSDKVDVTGKTTAKVHGILTILGITKPITLNVTLNKVGKNPINNKMTAGFTATTTIKRSEFGMNTLKGDLGDDVKITIGAEAYKAVP